MMGHGRTCPVSAARNKHRLANIVTSHQAGCSAGAITCVEHKTCVKGYDGVCVRPGTIVLRDLPASRALHFTAPTSCDKAASVARGEDSIT